MTGLPHRTLIVRKYAEFTDRFSAHVVATLMCLVTTPTFVVSQQGNVDSCRSSIEIRGVAFDREYFAPMTIERMWNQTHEYSVAVRDYASLMSVSALISDLRVLLDSTLLAPDEMRNYRPEVYVVVVLIDCNCVVDTIVIEPGPVVYRGSEYLPHAAFIERVSELMPAVFGKDMREEFKRIRAIRRE